MAGCRREFHRFAVHAGGCVQQDVETRIDGDALRPLDEYFRIFRFDSVQLCSIKPPLCGRIGSRHGERLHESLNPDGQSSCNQFYPSQRIRGNGVRRNRANLGDVQCSESMPPACAESFSFKIVPIVLGNESS